jgi:hypothetical protein
MVQVLVGLQGNSSRSPSSSFLAWYPGSMPDNPQSSSSRILVLTSSILAFTLSMVLGCLVFKEDLFAVKGGPNPGPRMSVLKKGVKLGKQ